MLADALAARAALALGDVQAAHRAVDRAQAQRLHSERVPARLYAATTFFLVLARGEGGVADVARARSGLADLIASARKAGLAQEELDARLALAQIELKQNRAAGQA